MPLHAVYGHDELRERLTTTMRASRLPPALVLTGPPGIGKQRLALWIAQGLVCDRGPGAPCDACHPCKLALQLSHPDIHWFFPIPRPKGDESKQVEEAEDALVAAIAARRETSLYRPPEGLTGLYLPLVRALHRRAQMRPAMGKVKAFVVGEADRLVPQASSPEAANAMLKVLEEPPPDTFFLLTTAEPAALLPTIRSRLVHLRAGRLKPADIARFLREVPDPPLGEAEAGRRAELAGGAISAALAAGAPAASRVLADGLLAAAAGGPAARWRYALATKPFGARAAFTDTLDVAAEKLRDELAAQLRAPTGGGRAGGTGEEPPSRLLAQVRELERARQLAQGNVNPQLVVAGLLRRLAEARG